MEVQDMEPKVADETWGKLGGEVVPVPVLAPLEIAEVTLFEALWLMQLRLWLQIAETWCEIICSPRGCTAFSGQGND